MVRRVDRESFVVDGIILHDLDVGTAWPASDIAFQDACRFIDRMRPPAREDEHHRVLPSAEQCAGCQAASAGPLRFAEGEEMRLLSAMQYPHWMMIAEGVLVALGFIGFALRQNRNIDR